VENRGHFGTAPEIHSLWKTVIASVAAAVEKFGINPFLSFLNKVLISILFFTRSKLARRDPRSSTPD